jgi:hypothetical protein
MKLLKSLELCAKIHSYSYFTIFVIHIHIVIKIIADSWSPWKTEYIDMSFVYFWRKKIFRKIPEVKISKIEFFFEKFFFRFWRIFKCYSTQNFMLIPNMCVSGHSFLGPPRYLIETRFLCFLSRWWQKSSKILAKKEVPDKKSYHFWKSRSRAIFLCIYLDFEFFHEKWLFW